MKTSRPSLSRWLRDNWLELLLATVFVAALVWIFQVGRDLWETATAEPTVTPTARPLVEADALRTPAAPPTQTIVQGFDGSRAQGLVDSLLALGPRPLGSPAHDGAAAAISETLRTAGWQVEEVVVDVGGVALRTVIGKAGSGPAVMLASHYDTPPVADLDPVADNRGAPVPGANDGTSGVAVLLALAQSLEVDNLENEVWLVFLDGQYAPSGGDPVSAGASAFSESLPSEPLPEAVILLDYVGAADQQFFIDSTSDPALSQTLWSLGRRLGYGQWFVAEPRAIPGTGVQAFRQRDIPAAAIAGLGYPYRRTVGDTADKIDPASLERVGRLLLAYLQQE